MTGRLALVYDTRDLEYNTHRGVLLEVGAQAGSGLSGYTRLYTVLRGYVSPFGRGRWSRRGWWDRAWEAHPPSMPGTSSQPWEDQISVLGGQYSHRSFDTGRFTGKDALFGNLEVRHDLIAFGDLGAITLLGFVDAGRVFEDEGFKLTTGRSKSGWGRRSRAPNSALDDLYLQLRGRSRRV